MKRCIDIKIVNLEAIKNNYYDVLRRCKNKKVYAVVKADAYGLGLMGITKFLISLGIKDYCCANINEALKLRMIDKKINILLLSDFSLNDVSILKDNNITVTISNEHKAQMIHQMMVQIKLNTGMNRHGIDPKYFKKTVEELKQNQNSIVGIYTHIASFDIADFYSQYLKFCNIVKDYQDIDIHFSSSKGIDLEVNLFNSIRIGMALYRDNSMTIIEKVARVNYCTKGSMIGYNEYIMKNDGYVAVVNIGYGDGLIKGNRGRYVYINQKYYQIIAICMNHFMILVDEKVSTTNEVEILGSHITLEYVSAYLRTIDYEILTSFKNQEVIYI